MDYKVFYMQDYQKRTQDVLEGLRDFLLAYVGDGTRSVRKTPPQGKWLSYELMKEGIGPEGIEFWLRIRHPEDFDNPVYKNLLSATLQQAHEEYMGSDHSRKPPFKG